MRKIAYNRFANGVRRFQLKIALGLIERSSDGKKNNWNSISTIAARKIIDNGDNGRKIEQNTILQPLYKASMYNANISISTYVQ